jgi:hypothetical protein
MQMTEQLETEIVKVFDLINDAPVVEGKARFEGACQFIYATTVACIKHSPGNEAANVMVGLSFTKVIGIVVKAALASGVSELEIYESLKEIVDELEPAEAERVRKLTEMLMAEDLTIN